MTAIEITTVTASVIAATAAVWSTGLPTRARNLLRHKHALRRERLEQEARILRFSAEPDLQAMEDRFDELFEAHQARNVPPELRALWGRVYRLASKSPVKRPFRFGSLTIQTWDFAMRINKDDRSVADVEWMDPSRMPVLPMPLITGSMEPVATVRE